VAALGRGLLWSHRVTARELRSWRERAAAIPDAPIRADALDAIAHKRDNVEGASLFSILPKYRDERVLKLLIAYQVMWDFLDSISERGAYAGRANGLRLHRALIEALDPEAPISDYYRYHPWKDDGGYLLTLVKTCRSICAELPSYRQIHPLIRQGVEGCAIQSLNHEREPRRRDIALKEWAEREFAGDHTLTWFEQAAAASAFTPHVFLALAAEPSWEQHELLAVYSAYFPWVPLAIAMLDSYLDLADDVASGSHSYISHYPSETVALERLAEIIGQIVDSTTRLPNSRRHAVLIEGIVAWHLSIESVNTPGTREKTRILAHAGGPLTRVLLPLVHLWRMIRTKYLSKSSPDRPQGVPEVTSVSLRTVSKRLESSNIRGRLPPGMPLPALILTYVYWRWPFTYMKRCQGLYGRCFTHRMTSFPQLVFLSDPDEVRAMLTAPAHVLHPGEGGAKIAPIVGEGSFMLLDEDQHVSVRRAVLPAFQNRTIGTETGWVEEIVRRAVGAWPRDVSVPLHPRLRALTLEVVLHRIFTWRKPESEERLAILRDRVLAMLDVTGSVVFPVPALRHGPGKITWKRFLRDRAEMDELIHALIAEHGVDGEAGGQDALGMLMAARNVDGTPMTELQLRDNVMSLILAGHETTAAQLAWAFQLLAHNPVAQQRLIEEIDDGSEEEYLTATVQEVLRHRPVFLFSIPRAVKQPIEIGGWTYRPPAHLLGCIYLLHHDPATYPEPDEFRPERFLEGQPNPYTWVPWGGGRKRCPGSHLAMLEMKTVLRTVLENMTVSPAGRNMERPRWRSVIVTPHAGSRVILRRREIRRAASPRRVAVHVYDRRPVRA
jgi:cytochrome P450